MIGVFDSGYGGLTILKELRQRLPDFSYLYLGDNGRAPYGSRSKDEIYRFTLEGVEYLMGQGCELVILACNTSSANALRRLQQEWLPGRYPHKRVLGILVPTIEEMTESNGYKTIAVMATEQTVRSGAYATEIKKHNPEVQIVQVACPALVPLIEVGADRELEDSIRGYIKTLEYQMGDTYPPDSILLGCTHYALIEDQIKSLVPENCLVFGQGEIVAKSLEKYFEKHQGLAVRLDKQGWVRFITTGQVDEVSWLGSRFFGERIRFEQLLHEKHAHDTPMTRP